jgi:hypothetical protein
MQSPYRYLAALMAVVSALAGLSIAIAAEAQDTSTVVRTASGTVWQPVPSGSFSACPTRRLR